VHSATSFAPTASANLAHKAPRVAARSSYSSAQLAKILFGSGTADADSALVQMRGLVDIAYLLLLTASLIAAAWLWVTVLHN
jgi:hypothetical protein